MEVRSGWNSEFARKKYDVTVDEADLARLLHEHGIDSAAQARLTVAQAHMLLYTTAEILARRTLMMFDPSQKDALAEEIEKMTKARKSLLEKLRDAG